MVAKVIESDTLIEIGQHFIVKAGPGAGKTYWLIQHIKNVLKNSVKLGKIKKIACITYTNIGVETIQHRLPNCADRVDVSTIHSFLYENIVKPYFHFIAEEYGFSSNKQRVVDDTILTTSGTIIQIKKKVKNGFAYDDDEKINVALRSAHWTFSNNGLKFRPRHAKKGSAKLYLSQEFYDEYKKYAWEKGIMHYDDVLFFSYTLISKYPFITKVISAKYPYIFLDEFQDSTPLQVEILKQFASTSLTTIGVIGDKAQAIYGFAGTDPSLFDKFKLDGMQIYEIQGNRRCSEGIIALLNSIRPDLKQYAFGNSNSSKPTLFVGDDISCFNEFKKRCGTEHIVTLAYANVTSNALRKQFGQIPADEKLLDVIPDKNDKRVNVLRNCVTAIEYALVGAIKDALKCFKKLGYSEREQIWLLKSLLEKYDTFNNQNMEYFLSYLKDELNLDIAGLRKGKAKDFYSSKLYKEIALYVTPPDISSIQNRTIHKAKGDEFDNVLVLLKEEKDINFLLGADLDNPANDEHRVYYVAISRAKNRLAIYIPTLSADKEKKLKELPLDIVRI